MWPGFDCTVPWTEKHPDAIRDDPWLQRASRSLPAGKLSLCFAREGPVALVLFGKCPRTLVLFGKCPRSSGAPHKAILTCVAQE